jgi:hypothetical protein
MFRLPSRKTNHELNDFMDAQNTDLSLLIAASSAIGILQPSRSRTDPQKAPLVGQLFSIY